MKIIERLSDIKTGCIDCLMTDTTIIYRITDDVLQYLSFENLRIRPIRIRNRAHSGKPNPGKEYRSFWLCLQQLFHYGGKQRLLVCSNFFLQESLHHGFIE